MGTATAAEQETNHYRFYLRLVCAPPGLIQCERKTQVTRNATATKLADNTDEVLNVLTARGINRTLAKAATKIARA